MTGVLTVKTQLKPISSHLKNKCPTNASVKFSCAQPPRELLRGICKFCTARGPGICQPRGHSRAFDTYAASYQNITTQKVLLEKTQIIAHLSRTGINCSRVVKACSRFYASISSLLIKQELIHCENRSCRCGSTFFGYWTKFLLILFEEHPFIFRKLFVTYIITARY